MPPDIQGASDDLSAWLDYCGAVSRCRSFLTNRVGQVGIGAPCAPDGPVVEVAFATPDGVASSWCLGAASLWVLKQKTLSFRHLMAMEAEAGFLAGRMATCRRSRQSIYPRCHNPNGTPKCTCDAH